MWLSLVLACSTPEAPLAETTPPVEVPSVPPGEGAPPAGATPSASLDALRADAEKNPGDAARRYALALGIADARAAKQVCENDAYLSSLIEEIGAAVKVDPSYKDKAVAEPKFAQARSTLEFWRAVGDPLEGASLTEHLAGVTLFPPTAGVYGNQQMAVLAPAGALTWREMKDTEHPEVFTETPGTWEIHGRVLALHVGANTYSLILGKDLHMVTSDGKTWSDFPSECEA